MRYSSTLAARWLALAAGCGSEISTVPDQLVFLDLDAGGLAQGPLQAGARRAGRGHLRR